MIKTYGKSKAQREQKILRDPMRLQNLLLSLTVKTNLFQSARIAEGHASVENPGPKVTQIVYLDYFTRREVQKGTSLKD